MQLATTSQTTLLPQGSQTDHQTREASLKQAEKTSLAIQSLVAFSILLQCIPYGSLVLSCADAASALLDFPVIIHWWLLLESSYFVSTQVSTRWQYKGNPQTSPSDCLEAWRKCVQDPTISAEEFITGWFYTKEADGTYSVPSLADIRQDNVLEWISWSIFNAHPRELNATQHAELDAALAMLQDRLTQDVARARGLTLGWPLSAQTPFTFARGLSTRLRSKRLNLEAPATNIRPRPLFYYAITDVIIGGLVTPCVMTMQGFSKHHIDGLTYWYRPPSPGSAGAAPSTRTPLVFVHGVGLGPLPYMGFVAELCSLRAPTLVLEIPWVSQRLSGGEAPNAQRTVDAIESALGRHGIKAATFVGHSLGSVYLSWMARMKPHLLASAVFIDPIVFMLHHYKVADSFLYDRSSDPYALVEKYFIKSEQRIVSYFHRHFFWYNNNLWADHLDFSTTVVLSGKDSIVPVSQVQKYFKSNPSVRLSVLPGAHHGEFLANAAFRRTVVDEVRSQQRAGWCRAGVTLPLVNDLSDLRTRLSALPMSLPSLPSFWKESALEAAAPAE